MGNTISNKEKHNDFKINNFSFLHCLGVLLVTLGHQYILMGKSAPPILGLESSNLGVKILFTVSGYLVMESYKRIGNAKKWLIKRVVRIWSGLIVCILGTTFILGPLMTTLSLADYFKYCKRYVISNLLMFPAYDLPGVFSENIYPITVNGSLWSLPVEVMCYIFLPLVYFAVILVKKKNKKIYVLFMISLLCPIYIMSVLREGGLIALSYVVWGTDWITASIIIIYFVLGVYFSCYGRKEKLKLQYAILLVIVYMIVPGIFKVIIRPIVIVYFVLALAFDYPTSLDKITRNFKCYYSFYLWSFPIQQTIIYIFIIKMDIEIEPLLLFMATASIIFFISYFINKYFEEPLNRWIAYKLKEKISE